MTDATHPMQRLHPAIQGFIAVATITVGGVWILAITAHLLPDLNWRAWYGLPVAVTTIVIWTGACLLFFTWLWDAPRSD